MKTPNLIFTYSDSEAGLQNVKFSHLSELINYIENFKHTGEPSIGCILQNEEIILEYHSYTDGITWNVISN